MSLSPVSGTANGLGTPVLSENGPKLGGSRVSPSGDHSEDAGNYVDVESSVYDGDGCLEMYNHERTSASPSLNSDRIGDSERCSRDVLKECEAAEPPGAALRREPALAHQQAGQASANRQQTVTEKLQDSPEEEEDDGEKEKQDEEEDEKNDNKWIHAGGRTKAEVGEL